MAGAQSLPSNVTRTPSDGLPRMANPGLRFIWKDEQQRRQSKGETLTYDFRLIYVYFNVYSALRFDKVNLG